MYRVAHDIHLTHGYIVRAPEIQSLRRKAYVSAMLGSGQDRFGCCGGQSLKGRVVWEFES